MGAQSNVICLSISLDASVPDPAFVSLVSAMLCRAEHAAFLLNGPADVISLFISCSSCFPDVAVVLDPKFPFTFWNAIEIGSHALFSSIYFGTSMWRYSLFDAVLLKELFRCILAIVPFRVVCV